MHPKEFLKKFLKLIGADTRSAIVSYIVVGLILAMGGLSALYKKTRDVALQMLTTPTPLWATISLVLLGCLYIHLKLQKFHSISDTSAPVQESKIVFFTIENLKWKATIYRPDWFEVESYPFCKEHDLQFIFSNSYFHCPNVDKKTCNNKIYIDDRKKFHEAAKSYIDKEIRNGNY